MKVRINYGKSGGVTVESGKNFVITRECDDATWSTRSGTVRLADGTEYEAVLEFCDSDSGEHYGTAIWTDKGLVWQEDFLEALGKTKEQIFPYKYRYHGYISGDHHTDSQF